MSMIARMREKSEVEFVDGVAITDADLQRMDDGAAQVHAMSSRAFDQNAEATRDAGHKSGGVCFVEHNASTETTLSTTADATCPDPIPADLRAIDALFRAGIISESEVVAGLNRIRERCGLGPLTH